MYPQSDLVVCLCATEATCTIIAQSIHTTCSLGLYNPPHMGVCNIGVCCITLVYVSLVYVALVYVTLVYVTLMYVALEKVTRPHFMLTLQDTCVSKHACGFVWRSLCVDMCIHNHTRDVWDADTWETSLSPIFVFCSAHTCLDRKQAQSSHGEVPKCRGFRDSLPQAVREL